MRNTFYDFVDADASAVLSELVTAYESITGRTLQPADPERLFIAWVCDVIVRERVNQNYIGNQNVPSRAEGENLDALGEYLYNITRLPATPSKCTVRFSITAAQASAIIIPKGTRTTDMSQTLIWETTEDATIPAGSTYVDADVECQTAGVAGNGYAIGQINTLIDVDDVLYYDAVTNTIESFGGAEEETDDEYYERMRLSLDTVSTAGAKGSYIYWAKSVSEDITDVVVNSPDDGEVAIYAIMKDGSPAGSGVKAAILAACSDDDVRPLTDHVSVEDANEETYNISLTYYVATNTTKSLASIAADVQTAVNDYQAWQCEKLGRDINPAKLWELLMATGIKRAVITYPEFQILSDGSDGSVPDVAKVATVSIVNGGTEDE